MAWRGGGRGVAREIALRSCEGNLLQADSPPPQRAARVVAARCAIRRAACLLPVGDQCGVAKGVARCCGSAAQDVLASSSVFVSRRATLVPRSACSGAGEGSPATCSSRAVVKFKLALAPARREARGERTSPRGALRTPSASAVPTGSPCFVFLGVPARCGPVWPGGLARRGGQPPCPASPHPCIPSGDRDYLTGWPRPCRPPRPLESIREISFSEGRPRARGNRGNISREVEECLGKAGLECCGWLRAVGEKLIPHFIILRC